MPAGVLPVGKCECYVDAALVGWCQSWVTVLLPADLPSNRTKCLRQLPAQYLSLKQYDGGH